MTTHYGHVLLGIGTAFMAALIFSRLLSKIHIPKVTAYLIVGLLTGPSLAKLLGYPALIKAESIHDIIVLSDIALAMIMLVIGSQFKTDSLLRWGKRLAVLSVSETLITFVLVGLSLFLTNLFFIKTTIHSSMSVLTTSIYLSVFMGVISIATAPAASLLVIREYESDGPVTDLVLALIGLNNLISIITFNIITRYLFQAQGSYLTLIWKLLAPVGLGILTGFIISIWAQKMEKRVEMQLLLLGAVIANVGISRLLHIDLFLDCFIAGVVIINSSPKSKMLFEALRSIDYPLYVLFFVIAGASLHIDALAHIGLLGIVYIIFRIAGKIFGSWIGTKLGGFGLVERKWLGYALMAQAGVAIGLSQTLAQIWPEGGMIVQSLILGSVVIFELIGPISVRHALVHSGEVPVLTLLVKRAPEGTYEGLHHVLEHFRRSLGIPVGHKFKSPSDILIQHVMRKNVDTINEKTHFNNILKLISHSKYDRFPIVDDENHFLGILDYSDIRDVLVDESLSSIVVARDLLKPEPLAVHPEQTLGEVLIIFQKRSDITYLPVVDKRDRSLLVGIISQNDILAAFRIPSLKDE